MDDAKKSENSEKVGVTKKQICLSIIAIFFVGWLFSSKVLSLIPGREYAHFPNIITYIFYKSDLNNLEYKKNFEETKDNFYQKRAVASNALPAYQKMSKYYFSPFNGDMFAISDSGEKYIALKTYFRQSDFRAIDYSYSWLKLSEFEKIYSDTKTYDNSFWSDCYDTLSMRKSMYSMYKVYESVGFELATVLGIGPYKEYYNYSRVGGLVQPAILVREFWYKKFQNIDSFFIDLGEGVSKSELNDIRYFVSSYCEVNYFFDFENMKYNDDVVEYYQLFFDRYKYIHHLYKVKLKLGFKIKVLEFDEVK